MAQDNIDNCPKITVTMPSFRQGQYLEEAIRSVLLQNYPRLEFLVFDGGSTDGSTAVIERYRPWLSFARSARDRGQAHAINLGLSLGSGEIFGWLNSDDFYLPGTLEHAAGAWRRGAEFIYGGGLELDTASGSINLVQPQYVCARYTRFPGLLFQPSTFWSARRHQPLWEEQHCALDYELWIRLLPGLKLRRVDAPLAVARKHGDAKTYDPAMKSRWDADAVRNGMAHPLLYANNLRNRWIAREYRFVQKVTRRWRDIGAQLCVDRVRQQCGWETPIMERIR